MAATKWFTPEIGLRTKLAGAWARSVNSNDKATNAVSYMHLKEDVMVSITNIIYGYDPGRKWDVTPYFGVGITRNFTHDENAMTFSTGVMPACRINNRLKVFCDLSFNITGDEFDDQAAVSKNIFKNHDRWLAAEIGIVYELGHNRWHRAVELENIEVVPWQETQREMRRINRQNNDLRKKITWMETNETQTEVVKEASAPTIVTNVPDISIFFELGSAELTHRGQLLNIRKLVKTAKDEHRTVIVTGYADSATGDVRLNEKLSARRADTIAREIIEMGIDAQQIKAVVGGGVDILKQIPANRRVIVSLEK